MLGKVWGFLKYHDPAVTSGTRHWDYELFRVLPGVLAARDRQSADLAMVEWARQLGWTPVCDRCAAPKDDEVHLRPDLGWMNTTVHPDLAQLLRTVYRGRSQGRQFYVAGAEHRQSAIRSRPGGRDADIPRRRLSAAGTLPVLEHHRYGFPYRDQLDEKWETVLAEFIPRIALAKDKDAYQLETLALIARVTDTHANLFSAPPESARLQAAVSFP